ncbi:MAG: SAM-dependent methyltransferase [Acidobacteriia bacterium]|nr:SAM-dependent methyltransferase [Terriglobia bacterium]
MSLRAKIEQEIRERGPMPFSRYMEICLYDPVQGYYSRNAEQFGKAGDFYTSSDVHAVFGRLLARQFEEMWRALDRPPQLEILELGPGRGLFARDVLDWSNKKFPDFFAALTYTLQESSPSLRARLQETLYEHLDSGRAAVPEERPSLAQRFSAGNHAKDDQVSEGRPTGPCRTLAPRAPLIIFANEFLDALPVEILGAQGKLHLALENGRLHEIWLPPTAEELEFLDRYSVHPELGERIEVSLPAQQWITQIAHTIQRGSLLIIDYGYTRNEQLAGHHRGTLMAYRQHSASANPYQAPGEQDLTAHVNFTALTAAATQAGMQVQTLVTQSQLLMRIGETNQFADAFEDCRLPQERAKVALQLKHLVTPAGMGENFQVLLARRE